MARTIKQIVRQKKKILIIDEHPVYREGFRILLERDQRYTVVGGAGTANKGIQMAKSLSPDLVAMEIRLPDEDAFGVIRTLRRLFPEMPVMILSAYGQMSHILQALQSGATGYLLKASSCESILYGLGAILRGYSYVDSSVSPYAFAQTYGPAWGKEKSANSLKKQLTPREQEVMQLLAKGVSRKQVAQMFSISPRTVENHAASIMKKLSLNNTIDLVRCAAKLGLIDMDEWKYEPSQIASAESSYL